VELAKRWSALVAVGALPWSVRRLGQPRLGAGGGSSTTAAIGDFARARYDQRPVDDPAGGNVFQPAPSPGRSPVLRLAARWSLQLPRSNDAGPPSTPMASGFWGLETRPNPRFLRSIAALSIHLPARPSNRKVENGPENFASYAWPLRHYQSRQSIF